MRRACATFLMIVGVLATGGGAQATMPDHEAADDPRETFEKNYVAFEGLIVIGASFRGRTWAPYLGKYHRPLAGRDFYRAIERPDLASVYTHRQTVEWSLLLGGWATILSSPFVGAKTSRGVTGVMLLAGITSVIVGWILEPDPLDESEAREAADIYNKSLKRRLDLTPAAPSSPPRTTVTWAPFIAPSAGGLALAVSF
jgi:hypothetical protein